MPHERRREDGRCEQRRAERAEERVPGRGGEPATVLARRDGARDQRIDEQTEADDERRAAEIGHQALLGVVVYFDGHFVTMSLPDNLPPV